MTEPTDKELKAFAVEEQFLLFCDVDEFTQIARAVLAKWTTTQPTQPQAGAMPLANYKAYALIDSMGWSLDDQEKDDMMRLLRATEAAHGIKEGQHD